MTIYRLYTETKPNLVELTSRYFKGASLIPAWGLWQGEKELSAIIEIIGESSDLQSIVNLAGDIREVNQQTEVLVTWHPVSVLHVNGE